MIPWVELGKTLVPGGGEMRLMRRGQEFSIRLGVKELMNSRLSGSEEALATLACARIAAVARPRVLIGGLGMGFTLRAALGALPAEAEIEVAELVPAVAQWAKTEMAAIFAGSLSDPRVRVELEDVAQIIGAARARYDAILLDVDNGPEGMTREANDGLYAARGLAAARAALRPGGVLAVWSVAPDRRFTQRLRQAGFATEEVVSRARGARGGARHIIWLATRPR
ncbi:MAG: spermidine synthase [Hyphomicrobiales bacterium]|nr:spermidine synthase [Hyphomicrobiales bacterium]